VTSNPPNVAPIDRAFAWILGVEGGDSNDPLDPGGRTRFGISATAHPEVDLENLTPEQAKAIYQRNYWNPCRCSELPESIALAVFDCAVNQGVPAAGRLLQRSLGIPEDGVIGPATTKAAQAALPSEIVTRFVCYRWDRYYSTPQPQRDRFLRGWTHRVVRLLSECLWLEMAKEVRG